MALACGSWSLEQILSVLQTMPLLVRVIDQTIPMEFLRRDLYDGVNKKKLDGSTLTPAFDEVLFLAGFTQVHKHARIQACLHIVRLKYRFEQQFLGEGGLYDDQTSSYREPDKPWENRSWQRIELRRMMVALVPFPLHFKNYVRHFMDILQFLGNSEEEIHSAMLQDVQRQDLGYWFWISWFSNLEQACRSNSVH